MLIYHICNFRLEKQKNEDDKTIIEKTKQIEELKHKVSLHSDSNDLLKTKETLEVCPLWICRYNLNVRPKKSFDRIAKGVKTIDGRTDESRENRLQMQRIGRCGNGLVGRPTIN